MPPIEAALASGSVSAGHVDAIALATRSLDESARAEFVAEADSLAAAATTCGVDAFGRHCREIARNIRARQSSRSDVDELDEQRRRSKVSRWVDRETGMHATLIECDPVTDRQFWSAVQRARAKLRRRDQRTGTTTPSWDRLTVDALVEAVSNPTCDGRTGMVVLVDLETLTDGHHEHTVCETDAGDALPIDTVRHLACDADIIPVVLDGRGVVLDEGRAKRLATREQRVAIAAMQTTCSHPDCSVTIDDCRIHHLDPWSRGGRTDLSQLAPLCERHHHLAHEGGWTFTMTPDRIGTWIRPDGVLHWTGSLLDRRPATAVAS